MTDHAYHVELWGSHPDEGNDDHWDSYGFAKLDQAEARFANECASAKDGVVVLRGPDLERVHDTGKRYRDDQGDWRREMAMEAGMLHGVEAYNDAMGWSIEEDNDG